MKPGEIRQLTNDELVQKLRVAEEDLFKANLKRHTGQLQNNAQLGNLKRDIARIKTEMTARRNAPAAASKEN